jgi:hypothetical protein
VIERPLRQSRGGDEREVDVAVAAAKPGMSEAADEIQTEQVAPEHLLSSLREAANKSNDGGSGGFVVFDCCHRRQRIKDHSG